MLPYSSYNGFGSFSSNREEAVQGVSSMEMMMMMKKIDGGDYTLSSRSTVEAKAIAANKSHSEAERRRRQRINGHLATLRTLLPNTTKTDKASLLAEVVRHVRELKKVAADVAAQDEGQCSSRSREYGGFQVPGEVDELNLSYWEGEEGSRVIRALFCCDDRPDLLSDLTQALRSVQARVVKAEMATVGGRTKSVFMIQTGQGGGVGGGGGGGRGGDDFGTIRRALKAVLDKPTLSSGLGQVLPVYKRPRLSHQLIANDF